MAMPFHERAVSMAGYYSQCRSDTTSTMVTAGTEDMCAEPLCGLVGCQT